MRVAGLRDMPGSRPATAFTLFAVRRAAVLVWVFFFFALGAIVTFLRHGGRLGANEYAGWTMARAYAPMPAAAALLSADIGEEQLRRYTVPRRMSTPERRVSTMEPGRTLCFVSRDQADVLQDQKVTEGGEKFLDVPLSGQR
jgi:hypothetical protein